MNAMKKPHIFIIEDCDMMRLFLQTYLAKSGIIQAFASGREAIQALSLDNWPDVIILDLNLPDIQGQEVLRILKKRQLLTRSKVVVLSGEDNATSRISCLSGGASDYLVKPFHPRELQLRLNKLLAVMDINQVA